MQTVTPHKFLAMRTDPIGSELDAMLARGLVVAALPMFGALHITYRCNSDEDRCDLLRQMADELVTRGQRPASSLVLPAHVEDALRKEMPTRARFKPSEWLKLRLLPIDAELRTLGAASIIAGFLPDDEGFEVCGTMANDANALRAMANTLRAEANRHRTPGAGIQVPPQSIQGAG